MSTKTASKTAGNGKSEDGADAPLLDTLGAAVKKLLAQGKERGFVTYDELNKALPQDQVSSEQIEDTMTTLSEMGINVVDSEESDDQSNDSSGESSDNGSSLRAAARANPRPPA